MFALRKHHFMAGASLVEAAVIIGGAIWLAPKYGVSGVAFATAVGMTLTKVLVQPPYLCRIVGISIWEFVVPLFVPLCIGTFIVALSVVLHLPDYLMHCPLLVWVLIGGVAGALYAAICVALTYRCAFFVKAFPAKLNMAAARVVPAK